MPIDRRVFLVGGIASGVAAVTGVHARAFAAAPIDRPFARTSRIADGVHVTIAEPKKGLQCYSNGGVISGRAATLIVEGHFTKEGADLEIEQAHAVSKGPIRGVIDTHWHLDHTFGNVGYAARGIPILAHEDVGRLMKQNYAPFPASERASRLARWEQRLREATDPVDKARKAVDLERWTWILDSINAATLAFPTEPLAAASLPMAIDLGGLTAVIEFHRGHSATDLIIRVPERDIVFTGDLLFTHALPVVSDSDFLAWRRVLDLFAAYPKATRFVPGHGAIGSVYDVREQAALMDDLRHHAEEMIRTGASVDEAELRYVVPKAFRDFEVLCWAFTVGGAMRTLYAELTGKRR